MTSVIAISPKEGSADDVKQLIIDSRAEGIVGLEKYKLKQFDKLDYPAKPRWPLDENAKFLKGAGVKL